MTTGQYCVSRNWKGLNTAKVPRVLTSYFLPLSLSQSSSIFTIISHSLHIITSTDLNRRHPANEEEHKENKSQAEQLRILVEGEDKTKQVGDEASQEVVERKEDVVGEVKGWAKQEEGQLVKRCGETEEEEEERRLEKARKEEEEMEVKKLDEMIAMREKERERQRLEEEEMRKRKAKEEEEAEAEKKETESKVDEENNSVPVTPIRKVLSRTSSFEVREEVFIVLPLSSSR